MTAKDKFRGGMEFSFVQQFKQAVLDHNLLIGREVRFPKNDK
ncbi:hypothetical protein A2U01_0080495, partial [Trifolium medium]|nr:hypothetical protein [Trifolium medium]